MKSLIPFSFLLTSVFSFSALATPGDISCTADIDGGQVEVIVARDNMEEPYAYIELLLDSSPLAKFEKNQIRSGSVEASVDSSAGVDSVFMNSYYSGVNEKGFIYLRFPEQDPESSSQSVILSTGIPAAPFSVSDVELNCQF